MPTADELLGPDEIAGLVSCLQTAHPGATFEATARAAESVDGLSLSGRVFALRDGILADLGGDFDAVEATMRAALLDPAFAGWMTWSAGETVAMAALASPDPSAFARGLELMAALTPRLTSEFAIRGFLEHDLDAAIALITPWTSHRDPSVRRLASEGTRPRLPWAKRVRAIFARPEAAIPLLDALYRDDDEVVRRSVANHLNDISRLDPALAVATCARWLAAPAPETPRLVRHALRTLVKEADASALTLLGFGSAAELDVVGPVLAAAEVPAGGELAFRVSVRNRAAAPVQVAIDYVVHFRKASGQLAPKVFKISARTLDPGEEVVLDRRRSFKPLTTRAYHPGEHAIEVQVNGQRSGRAAFTLGSS